MGERWRAGVGERWRAGVGERWRAWVGERWRAGVGEQWRQSVERKVSDCTKSVRCLTLERRDSISAKEESVCMPGCQERCCQRTGQGPCARY